MHYARLRRHGSPTVTLRQRGRGAAAVRWQEKYVEEPGPLDTPCWIWTGGTSHGYGAYNGDQFATRLAHRYIYQVLVGLLADDVELDHLCRRTLCVRPDHLDPVAHKINVERGKAGHLQRAVEECPAGHAYTPGNTKMNHGHRNCRECARKATRDAMRRKRAAARQAAQESAPPGY